MLFDGSLAPSRAAGKELHTLETRYIRSNEASTSVDGSLPLDG